MAKISISEKQARFYIGCMDQVLEQEGDLLLHLKEQLRIVPNDEDTQETRDNTVARIEEVQAERDSLAHKLHRVAERRAAKG